MILDTGVAARRVLKNRSEGKVLPMEGRPLFLKSRTQTPEGICLDF